jgi:ribosomal protein L40E
VPSTLSARDDVRTAYRDGGNRGIEGAVSRCPSVPVVRMPFPDCPFCGHQNPASAKFCNDCGSPLHLSPCGECGAVSNVADTHCWRCGALLLPLDAPEPLPQQVAPGPAAPAVSAAAAPELAVRFELPTQQELELELVALEREVQDLAPAPSVAPQPAPTPPREPRVSGRAAVVPVLNEVVLEPRRRSSGVMTAAAVTGVIALAIAVGAYLYALGQPPSLNRAPAQLQAPAPTSAAVERRDAGPVLPEPRVAREVREAAAALSPPTGGPPPNALDASIERRLASDGGEAPAAGTPAAAPDPSCPRAVAALALCEWLAGAKRQ